MSAHNRLAQVFRALHKPGSPVVLANVYDVLSARTVAALPSCKALATASYAVARAHGVEDSDMQLETNLSAVRGIVKVAHEFDKPLTVDIQDAYGDRLEEAIREVVKLGVSGVNLEDCDKQTQKLHPVQEAVSRIHRALAVAREEGVPDFVINARCDTLMHGGEMPEVLQRGKAYLDAGATSVFGLGGSKREISTHEIAQMVKEVDGRLNFGLKMSPGNLTVKELAQIGVARISVGPQLQFKAMATIAKEAEALLES
jgi:2-methylisocitrate lyase-like PEP mutase family enzyme